MTGGARTPTDSLFALVDDVVAECAAQDARWGQQNHPDGTGLPGDTEAADLAREITNGLAQQGTVTWREILTEEVKEAFAETDPEKLDLELKQVSAVAVQWRKALRRRQGINRLRVYVSGQITGLDRDEANAMFIKACAELAEHGFEAVNPFDIANPTDCTCPAEAATHTWACCLTKDVRVLVGCDVLYMLPNWQGSQGAGLEHFIASALGLQIMYALPEGARCESCQDGFAAGEEYTTLPGVGLYTHLRCEPPSLRQVWNLVNDVDIAEAMAHDLNDDLDISRWWDVRDSHGGWDSPAIQRAAEAADAKVGDSRYPAANWCRAALAALADIAGDHIRTYYKVPAHIHGRIRFCGSDGIILGFDGGKLHVQLADRALPIIIHPTWRVEYHTAEAAERH